MAETKDPSPSPSKPPTPVIIDTDPGVDDMVALLFALASPEIDVLGITLVMGNNDDMNILARNACLALEIAGRDDIPVTMGATRPLVGAFQGQSGIVVHGANGIGNVQLGAEPGCGARRVRGLIGDWVQSPDYDPAVIFADEAASRAAALAALPELHPHHMEAAEFIAATCRARPGEVTLITLGPLTNVALALRAHPELATDAAGLSIMGGDTRCVGNKAPGAEANVANDPEAAGEVFTAFPDIIMAGLNLTSQVWMTRALRGDWRDRGGPVGRFLFDVTQYYVERYEEWGTDGNEVPMHDICAVMAVVRPHWFPTNHVRVEVETAGEFTRGLTLVDWRRQWGRAPQTRVLTGVASAEEFRMLVSARIQGLSDRLGEHGLELLAPFVGSRGGGDGGGQ